MTDTEPTYLAFQHDGDCTTHSSDVISVLPASSLDETDKPLFKEVAEDDQIVITRETIFHPQGGGQPSDVGTMKSSQTGLVFTVKSVRSSASRVGIVYHLGQFNSAGSTFAAGEPVLQEIDAAQRLLFSRYHTAGHVLGAAVRSLLEKEVEGFDELKASHFPDSASCEFAGLIAGSHKDAIQKKVDEYIDKDMAVEIGWWDEDDFKQNGYERLIPDKKMLLPGETKFRVVRIVGAEAYPCGGTHVHTTKQCGKTTVKKISRSKGTSRVSYTI
ncbi:hypothetical protein ACMFMF_003102 [Clarireedia jacksonii]